MGFINELITEGGIILKLPTILWMVQKSCPTWDARKLVNNGMFTTLFIGGFRIKKSSDQAEIFGRQGLSATEHGRDRTWDKNIISMKK